MSVSLESARATLLQTPALSAGLPIFSVLFYLAYPKDSTALVLEPSAPLNFNLNAISFYIFPHVNIVHLGLNLVALFPLITQFERVNGTIYTGVTLNLLAVSTALAYCVVGLVLFPNESVAGLSGICFSLLTYFCHKEHVHTPVLYRFQAAGHEISIPTEYVPFLNLFVVAIFVPSTSFFGHLAAIGAGYLLALDYLRVLYPPSRILLTIESKLAPGIAQLKKLVNFVSEEDAVALRGNSYQPIWSTDVESGATVYEPFERRLGT